MNKLVLPNIGQNDSATLNYVIIVIKVPADQIGDNLSILAGCSNGGYWALQWRQQPMSSCLWAEGSCPWVEGPHTDLVLASDAKMIGSPLRLWSNKSSTPLSSYLPGPHSSFPEIKLIVIVMVAPWGKVQRRKKTRSYRGRVFWRLFKVSWMQTTL